MMISIILLLYIFLFNVNSTSDDPHFVTQHISATVPITPSIETSFVSSNILKTSSSLYKNPKHCQKLHVDIDWSSQVESSVYATPIIRTAPIKPTSNNRNANSIIASTYVHFIESLAIRNGNVLPGWPMEFDGSEFPTSPMLYDIDHDGHKEILVVDKSGHLFVVYITESGTFIRDDIVSPFRLRVRDSTSISKSNKKENEKAEDDKEMDWEWTTRVLHIDQQEQPRGPEQSKGQKSNTILGPGHRIIDPRPKRKTNSNTDNDDWRTRSWNELTSLTNEETLIQQNNQDENGWNTLTGHVLSNPLLYEGSLYVVTSHFQNPNNRNNPNSKTKTAWSAISITRWSLGKICNANEKDNNNQNSQCVSSSYPTVRWSVVLEISKKHTLQSYSSPSIFNLNSNNVLNLLISTSSGSIYEINALTGQKIIRDNKNVQNHKQTWKSDLLFTNIQMGEIQSDFIIEDVTNESKNLNVIVVDMLGNIVCFNSYGKIIWDVKISHGGISSSPILTMNQKYNKESVVLSIVTSTGSFLQLNAKDGSLMKQSIKLTNSKFITSITPMIVRRRNKKTQEQQAQLEQHQNLQSNTATLIHSSYNEVLHFVVPGLDGKIYIVHNECITTIDIGEHIYSDIIVYGTQPNSHVSHLNVNQDKNDLFHHDDDANVNGLELTSFIVATMHGNIISFVVDHSIYNMIDSWNGKAPKVMSNLIDGAITLSESSVQSKNGGKYIVVSGHTFHIHLNIHAARKRRQGPYHVVVRRGSRVVGQEIYQSSGQQIISLSLDVPGIFVLDITSTNSHGQSSSIELIIDYNTQVATSVINMVTIPMVIFTGMVIMVTMGGGSSSGSSSTHRRD